jgi:pimeloyl-ACP methyl ester carboxylesterase
MRPARRDWWSPHRADDDDAVRVMSTDHVSVAIHEFGGTGRPLLLSHATGFHGYCYLPIADRLADRFECFALDYRGHGSTPRPDDWQVDWTRDGDDALAAARSIAPDGGIVGFGHSMGGAALLMAAHRDPDLFDLIVAFEPIVFPTDVDRTDDGPSAMVEAARRRRESFESFEAAIENYASKPPMDAFDPDVLRLYVGHGFRPAPEGVRLTCSPEHEARTFETGATHATWDLLPEIGTPVVVIESGDGMGPAEVAPAIAERLPNARLIEHPDADHFEPFVDPAGTAELIADAAIHPRGT